MIYTSESGIHFIEVNKDDGAEEIEFYFTLGTKSDKKFSKIIANSQIIALKDDEYSVFVLENSNLKKIDNSNDIGFIDDKAVFVMNGYICGFNNEILYDKNDDLKYLAPNVFYNESYIAIYADIPAVFSKISQSTSPVLNFASIKCDLNLEFEHKIHSYTPHFSVKEPIKKSPHFDKVFETLPDEWKTEFLKNNWIDQQLLVARLHGDVLECKLFEYAKCIVDLPPTNRSISTNPTPTPYDNLSVDSSPMLRKNLNVPAGKIPHKTPPKRKQPSPIRNARSRTNSLNNSTLVDPKKNLGIKREVSPMLKTTENLRINSRQTESVFQLAVNTANILPQIRNDVTTRKTESMPSLYKKIAPFESDYYNLLFSSDRHIISQNLLETSTLDKNYYVNVIKSCLISASQGQSAFKNTLAQAAKLFENSNSFKEAAELHILNENILDACICLQAAGLWNEATNLASSLSKEDEITFQVKYAIKLYDTSIYRCIEALLKGYQFHKVLQILINLGEIHKAVVLIILFKQRGIIVKRNWSINVSQYFYLSNEDFESLEKPGFLPENLSDDIEEIMNLYIKN